MYIYIYTHTCRVKVLSHELLWNASKYSAANFCEISTKKVVHVYLYRYMYNEHIHTHIWGQSTQLLTFFEISVSVGEQGPRQGAQEHERPRQDAQRQQEQGVQGL
jgi:hypothetical protein